MEIDCKMNIVSLEMDRGVEVSTELDECSGWTNEKHNAYLDSLENSFVKQLYSFIGGDTRRLSTTLHVQSNSLKSTDQFNFGKKRVCTMGSGVQGNLLCNEETKHSGDGAFNGMYLRNSVGYECLAQSTSEASGQNFKEEEKRFDSEVTRKREREANNDGSSSLKDQVVPVRTVKTRM